MHGLQHYGYFCQTHMRHKHTFPSADYVYHGAGAGLQAKRAAHAAIEETGVTAAFPIMATKHNTWEAVTAIDRIQPSIRPTSAAKIKASKVTSTDTYVAHAHGLCSIFTAYAPCPQTLTLSLVAL